MSSLNRTIRLAALPAAAVLIAGAGCHRQAAETGPTPATGDSVDVGYGEQAKRDVTGSVAEIDTKRIRRGSANTMADLLEGRIPGLEVRRLPDGSVSLRVRGGRSFSGSDEPLLIVDGTPVSDITTALQDIDPRDVQSVSVLKDGGSLAAYGSRGANGVVLITTKKQ